jgi:hypothetical protein
MTRRVATVAAFLLAAVCIVAASGCAGTQSSEPLSNPELIRKEIAEIAGDIINAEEMYKATLTELQMEESADRRRQANELWIELEHLRSRKAALEERLAELEAEGRQ